MSSPVAAERDPDRLPDSTDLSGPCPRCGKPSSYESTGTAPLTFTGTVSEGPNGRERVHDERLTILKCAYCQQNIVVIEAKYVGGVRDGGSGPVTWRGIYWWPTPDAGNLGTTVPGNIASSYAEGVRCLSANSPNGAVALFRTSITYMVEDKGSVDAKSKGNLKEKIKQMMKDGGPLGALGDWADHVRLYGNAGAHPDLFGDVSAEEARDVSKLVHTMIELLYVMPANIAKRQSARRK